MGVAYLTAEGETWARSRPQARGCRVIYGEGNTVSAVTPAGAWVSREKQIIVSLPRVTPAGAWVSRLGSDSGRSHARRRVGVALPAYVRFTIALSRPQARGCCCVKDWPPIARAVTPAGAWVSPSTHISSLSVFCHARRRVGVAPLSPSAAMPESHARRRMDVTS